MINRFVLTTFVLLCFVVTSVNAVSTEDGSPVYSDVFVSGTYGYNTYRIPSIVGLDDGTLLAFAEGRKNSSSDSGDIDIVLCRSTDNGATWSSPQIVWSNGVGVAGNPCPVVDQATGNILLVSNHQTAGVSEGDIRVGNGERTYQIQSSSDGGLTWTDPTQIMAIEAIDPHWLAGGPNHGLQLQRGDAAGRIVIAGNHSIDMTGTSYPSVFAANEIHTIYSDDGGQTWQLGAVSGDTGNIYVSEVAATELPDGSLYFTIRDQYGPASGNRAFETSHDAGESFDGVLQIDPTAVAPVCQGSILEFSAVDLGDTENRVLMSYPGSASTRENITVRSSFDSCQTWNSGRVIYDGASAYSDLVRTVDDQVGLLFERDSYSKITFARFSTEWLDGEVPVPEDPGPWPSQYADTIMADHPIAYYRMDETYGDILHDVSGNERHATLQGVGSPTYGVSNPLTQDANNAAMSFAGDSFFSISDTDWDFDFGATQDFTIEFWFKTDDLPGENGIPRINAFFGKGSSGTNLWGRMLDDDTIMTCLDYPEGYDKPIAPNTYADNQWHQFVVVADRDAAFQLYIDGVLVAEDTNLGVGSIDSDQPLTIAQMDSKWFYYGELDEFVIFDQALTPSQIQAHFDAAVAKIPGDANNDGRVDGSDVTILAGNWQAGVGDPNTSTVTWEMGDFNGDGQIDGSDVTILAGNWQYGVDAAAASVPEPSSVLLLVMALVSLMIVGKNNLCRKTK